VLVTNRADNSISVLSISGKDVKVTDTVAMGDSVAHVAISPDGTKALAVKPVVNKVAFLRINGGKVVYEKYDMPTGVFPYNVDIVPSGEIAIVANNGAAGAADGNVDTVSVIDLQQNPPRVIDHVVVGDSPEGFAISPKGDLALAILVAGNSDKKAWFSRKNGTAVVLKIDGKKVTKVGEIEVGGLAEGGSASGKVPQLHREAKSLEEGNKSVGLTRDLRLPHDLAPRGRFQILASASLNVMATSSGFAVSRRASASASCSSSLRCTSSSFNLSASGNSSSNMSRNCSNAAVAVN
jgi:hypothetical protein